MVAANEMNAVSRAERQCHHSLLRLHRPSALHHLRQLRTALHQTAEVDENRSLCRPRHRLQYAL